MTQPTHTPGPIKWSEDFGLYSDEGTITDARNGTQYDDGSDPPTIEISRPDARLLVAAYNAFDSAARALNCNAVELAERMADGGVAALVEAVRAAKEMSDWFMQHSRQADHAHSELKQPLHETAGWKEMVDAGYNGLMASYHSQFEEALAKVKGGAV